jgi:hypothetical protein
MPYMASSQPQVRSYQYGAGLQDEAEDLRTPRVVLLEAERVNTCREISATIQKRVRMREETWWDKSK